MFVFFFGFIPSFPRSLTTRNLNSGDAPSFCCFNSRCCSSATKPHLKSPSVARVGPVPYFHPREVHPALTRCPGCVPSLRKRLSMSESSHTESDSSPPLTVRRRCSGLLDMPRFAISADDDGAALKRPQSEGMLLSTVQAREGLPVPIPEQPVEHDVQLEGDAGATTPSTAASMLAGTCLVWGVFPVAEEDVLPCRD